MSRPLAERIARDLLAADKVSESAVRSILVRVPIAEATEVMAVLAAFANRDPAAIKPTTRIRHDPDRPIPEAWSADELKAAHSAYARRYRDHWTVTGERLYQREKKAKNRVANPAPNGGRFMSMDAYRERASA